jgi:hypothetical protein
MAVGNGLRTMNIKDKACALTGWSAEGASALRRPGIVIEVDRPDVFRSPATKLGGSSPAR